MSLTELLDFRAALVHDGLFGQSGEVNIGEPIENVVNAPDDEPESFR